MIDFLTGFWFDLGEANSKTQNKNARLNELQFLLLNNIQLTVLIQRKKNLSLNKRKSPPASPVIIVTFPEAN